MDFKIGQTFKGKYPPEAAAWASANRAQLLRTDDGFVLAPVGQKAVASAEKGAFPADMANLDEQLKAGDTSVRSLSYPRYDGEQPPVGIALIQCHYGTDEKRLAATRKALAIMAKSNPRPAEWVLIEAQSTGVTQQLDELASRLGITYRFVRVPEASGGIFIKEALWNLGAKEVSGDRLVFLDSDCAMCNTSWAVHVHRAMEDFDFGSPHGFAYYGGLPDGEDDRDYRKVMVSTGQAWLTGQGNGHPGFGVFMSRAFYNHIGGLPCTSSAGGDSWLWYMVLGHWKRPYSLCRLPYNAPYILNIGVRPVPRIGATRELCCHIDHGLKSDRQYQAQALLARWCTTRPFEDIRDNPDTGLPEWRGNAAGVIHRKVRQRLLDCMEGMDMDSCIIRARELYDQEAEEILGPIDDDHPLIIATSLRSGDQYDADHVLMLRDLFARFCLTPHQFWCFSDTEIPGVHTIPLVSGHRETPYFYAQQELYRDVYPKQASVLTCDLDAIPIREFTMHRATYGQMAMGWEQHNWPQSNRCLWNGGVTYFRGDFSFVFDEYISGIDGGGVLESQFAFISSQEFINGSLYRHGIVPHDILAHLCMEFYHGDGKLDVAASTLVHFLGKEKPWTLRQKPVWLPQLAFRPHERRRYR